MAAPNSWGVIEKNLANTEPFSNRISVVNLFSLVAAPGSWFSPRSAEAAATSGPKPRRCKVHNGLSGYNLEAQGPLSQSPAPSPHQASITFGVDAEWSLVKAASGDGRVL